MALMARVGLDNLDIPTNPQVKVEVLDGSNEQSVEDSLQIGAICFHQSHEQVEAMRLSWYERLRDPVARESEVAYLARLQGTAVATATLLLQGGVAYLGGAATLPLYRGKKIYSTLLRRRLEDARTRGYQIAVIVAQPMSRRVVERYDFREYERSYKYGWMPVIDRNVIRSLVPDE
jgi:GNAT superfamily N-acetyltransferase